jgi:putative DNA primase/helicase
MLLVPFNAVIPEAKQDRHLADKIKATEMPGVLKWALEGLRSLEEMGGFIEPEACKQALEQYKRDMNPLVIFLEENFEPTNYDHDKVETKRLRQCYEQWCGDHGFKKLWPYVEKKQFRQGGDRNRYYIKLKLKDDSEFNDEV